MLNIGLCIYLFLNIYLVNAQQCFGDAFFRTQNCRTVWVHSFFLIFINFTKLSHLCYISKRYHIKNNFQPIQHNSPFEKVTFMSLCVCVHTVLDISEIRTTTTTATEARMNGCGEN